MTIEGLGRKFQEARRARNLTLDEAARMTKIRPARLAEIEADDFSQFPSLAYAKGFLVIYGKFLDVDVTPYLDAFEDSKRVTVDGYSYLQDNPPARPISAPVVRRSSSRAPLRSRSDRVSPMPLIFGVVVLVVGFSAMKLIVNVQRLAPRAQSSAQVPPSPAPVAALTTAPPLRPAETSMPNVASAPSAAAAPVATAVASPFSPSGEPEVRRAKPVTKEDLKAQETASSSPAESGETQPASSADKADFRAEAWKFGFTGSRCQACGTRHLPPTRVCLKCRAVDRMTPERMADVPATIATYTVDRLAYSLSPPVVVGVLDFEGGGRFTCAGLHVEFRRHLDGSYSLRRGAQLFGRYDAHGRPMDAAGPVEGRKRPRPSTRTLERRHTAAGAPQRPQASSSGL